MPCFHTNHLKVIKRTLPASTKSSQRRNPKAFNSSSTTPA
jgi:hypothetical protein